MADEEFVPPSEPAAETQSPEWSEETKGAICFYCALPTMIVGGLIAFNQGNPMPLLASPVLLVAFSLSIGAIYFRYYEHNTEQPMGPLAVFCAPIVTGLALIGAIAMTFLGPPGAQ